MENGWEGGKQTTKEGLALAQSRDDSQVVVQREVNVVPMWLADFFAALRSMWGLSSLTRDRTCTPYIVSAVLTTGPPGESPVASRFNSRCFPV